MIAFPDCISAGSDLCVPSKKSSKRFFNPSLFRRVGKNARTAVFATLAVLAAMCPFAGLAYEYDAEAQDIIGRMYAEGGRGWVCYWELMMPDRMPTQEGVRIIPGLTGYSSVEFGEPGVSGFAANEWLYVSDFAGGYRLPVFFFGLGSDRFNIDYETEFFRMSKGLRSAFFFRAKLSEGSDTSDKRSFTTDADVLTAGLSMDMVVSGVYATGEDSFEIRLDDSPGGYVFFHDWDGGDRYINQTLRGTVWYVSSVRLSFFRSSGAQNATATMTSVTGKYDSAVSEQRNTATYPVLAERTDTNGETETFAVSGLYGLGAGLVGDVWDYNHNGGYGIAPSATRLEFSADGTVAIPDAQPGMLRISPFVGKIEFRSSSNIPSALSYDILEESHYYTDYVIASEESFGGVRLPEGRPLAAEAEAMYRDFMDAAAKPGFTPVGTWHDETAPVAVNTHWDGHGGRRVNASRNISFPKHYLIPVRYHYMAYEGSDTHFYDYCNFNRSYVIVVEGLDASLPAGETVEPDGAMTFDLEEYGNDGNETGFIYLKGRLYTPGLPAGDSGVEGAVQPDLFLVRGRLDFASGELSDTDKGHDRGLWLDPAKYGAGGNRANQAPGADATDICMIIPVCDLEAPAEPEAENDCPLTLYCRYGDAAQTRFRPLAMLTDNDITTSAAMPAAVCPISPFTVTGTTLTAHEDIRILDVTGRLLASVPAGKSVTLPPGAVCIVAPGYAIPPAKTFPPRKIVVTPVR